MSVSWRIRESNPRPRACWARALPTELIPHWNFRHLPTTSTTDLSYPPTPPKDIAATVKVPLRFATQLLVLNRLPLIPYRSNLTLSKNWHFSLLLRPWIEHGASRSSVLRSPNWAIKAVITTFYQGPISFAQQVRRWSPVHQHPSSAEGVRGRLRGRQCWLAGGTGQHLLYNPHLSNNETPVSFFSSHFWRPRVVRLDGTESKAHLSVGIFFF